MKHTTRPPTTSRPTDPAPLGLSRILTELLPRTLHTPGGPERYTVSAVFTRRPSPGEIAAIDGDEARAWLDAAHFPQVTTKVSDRRLEIANTNLDELQAGLSTVIAELLVRLSVSDEVRIHALADGLVDLERAEEQRWKTVSALLDRIRFREPKPSEDGAVPLGLSRIVTALLPLTLGTDAAPRRYTIVAEFTRPPTDTEQAMITGPLPRQRLTAAGYPDASLSVRDRRLEIHETELAELANGLADAVADALSETGTAAAAQDARVAAEAARLAEQESERARYVEAAAAAITFVAAPGPDSSGPDPLDRGSLGEWEDEGGSTNGRTRPAPVV